MKHPLQAAASFYPQNILIRMPNWLGDLVMATPVLADLRRHWPKAKITAMCQGGVGALLQENPYIDEIFQFQRPKGLVRKNHLLDSLQKGHYDLGILLTNSFSSAWWFWRGNVQNRIGYATHYRSWFLHTPVPFPKNKDRQHLVLTYKMLLEPLGIFLSADSPHLYLNEQEQHAAHAALSQWGVDHQSILIGINPGAAYGSAKCWLPERFQQVARQLLENPRVVLLFFGDKGGTPLVDEICQGFSKRVINLAGKTSLRELMAFIKACHIFLTNDSGPMHIASALGTPLVALFGSTSDVATGPYQGGKVIHKHVECSPCYKRTCPLDFRCMRRIEVQEVYDEIHHLIKHHSL
jgi:heptosyltransferase II